MLIALTLEGTKAPQSIDILLKSVNYDRIIHIFEKILHDELQEKNNKLVPFPKLFFSEHM